MAYRLIGFFFGVVWGSLIEFGVKSEKSKFYSTSELIKDFKIIS
jgi:hypothetical protein